MDASFRGTELIYRARETHGDLVGQWQTSGADVVNRLHGPFCSASENFRFTAPGPRGIAFARVMLLATYEVVLERVTGDSSRGLSKDPKSLDDL